MTSRMSDERLDGEIRAFLDWHAGDVSDGPPATEVAMRIAHAQSSRTFGGRARLPAGRGLAIVVALLALLAVLFATAAILGSRLLIVPDRDSGCPRGRRSSRAMITRRRHCQTAPCSLPAGCWESTFR